MNLYVVTIEQPFEPGNCVYGVWDNKETAIAALHRLIAEEFDEDNGDVIDWKNEEWCEVHSEEHGNFIYTVNSTYLNPNL